MSRVWLLCAVVLAVVSGALAFEVFEPVQDSCTGYKYDWDTGETWFADENYGDSEFITIHSHDGWYYEVWKGYIQFDLSSVDPDDEILKAYFRFYYVCYSPHWWGLYHILEEWEEMEITHNNAPEIGLFEIEIEIEVEGWNTYDFPVDWVQEWVDNPVSNYGIFIASDESYYDWPGMRSRETEYPPQLIVYFDTDDTEPPACTPMAPDDGESGFRPNRNIIFNLTDDFIGVDTDTILFTLNLEDERSPGHQGFLSVGNASNTLIEGSLDIDDEDPLEVVCTFNPYDNLPWGAYTCTVDGSLSDLLGKQMGEDYVWTFDTYGYDEDPPEVTDLDPEDGEDDVPPDSAITFHLTDDYAGVDISTIEFSIRDEFYRPSSSGIKGALSQSGHSPLGEIEGDLEVDSTDLHDVVCTFTPDEKLPVSLITCTVAGSLADRDGNALGDDFVWMFTVDGAAVDEKSWGEIKGEFR